MEIRLETWCASCVSGRGEIKEMRGGPLDEAGMWAVMSPKEERKEREGGLVRGMRHESRELTGCWEKEKRTVHKDDECGTMPQPRENGELEDPTQMASAGHTVKQSARHSAVN